MPEGTSGGPERPQVSNEGSVVAIAQRSEISNMPQQLRSVEKIITDAQRHAALSGNIPKIPEAPDLGGERSDRDLEKVITGEVIEHKPVEPTEENSARGWITGLKKELPPEIAQREAAAKQAGFSAEHPMTPDIESVLEKAAAELEDPQQPVNLMRLEAAPPPPEGPRGPELPPRSESNWGPEFEREGILVRREIIHLESLEYNETYSDGGKFINSLIERLKDWRERRGTKSYTRKPFQEPDEGSISEAERIREQKQRQAELEAGRRTQRLRQETEEIPQQELEGLPTPTELLTTYKDLRRDSDMNPDEQARRIEEVEEQISRYFLEAKRLGVLDGADESLRGAYVDIMRGVFSPEATRKLRRAEVQARVNAVQAEAIALTESSWEAEKDRNWRNRELVRQLDRVKGVGELYVKLAAEKLAILNKSGGILERLGEDGIRGAFEVQDASLEELNEMARGNLDWFTDRMPSDEELRADAAFAYDGEDPEKIDHEFERLKQRRDDEIRKATRDMEGAGSRQAADLERYRQMEMDRRLFWKPTYANYFEVYATTEEEFQIVVDTFTIWLRSGVSKSPPELFQRVKGMIDALTTAGQRAGLNAFAVEKKEELEFLGGVMGGNNSLERYNAAYNKQFMDETARDTGPARFLRGGKSNRGKVAAALWKFDHDPRMELAFAAQGRRSQLLLDNSSLEQEAIQEEALQMLTFAMMACELKAYDPRDPQKRLHSEYADKEVRVDPFKENLEETVKFSTTDFKELYDGFDPDAQKKKIAGLGLTIEQLLAFQKICESIAGQVNPAVFNNNKRSMYAAVRIAGSLGVDELGDMPDEMKRFYTEMQTKVGGLCQADLQYAERLLRADRMERLYLEGEFDPSKLKGLDQKMYEEANNAVTLAYEMYGVMGEKAKRGGAVVRVERWVEIDGKMKKVVDAIPMHYIAKIAHFAENWVKATYGAEDLDPEVLEKLAEARKQRPEYAGWEAELARGNISNERRAELEALTRPKGVNALQLKYLVDQARRMAIWQIKTHGYDAKLYDFQIYSNGFISDPNMIGYTDYGADLYANNLADRNRYNVPVEPRYIGYTKKRKDQNDHGAHEEGMPVVISFDAEGNLKPKYVDKTGKLHELGASDYEQGADGKIYLYEDQHEGSRLAIDNIRRNTKAKQMLLKRPAEVFNPLTKEMDIVKTNNPLGYNAAGEAVILTLDAEGKPELPYDENGKVQLFDSPDPENRVQIVCTINENSRARIHEDSGTVVELAPVDYNTATHHIYSRWTGHPYWGYQEQDTELFLKAEQEARLLQQGLTTPKRVSPHAVQLSVSDASLTRTGNHEVQALRDYINLGSVEESYQGHFRILDEIHQNFYPADATMDLSCIDYNLQDFSGSMKTWIDGRALAMRWPDALMRRYRTMASVMPFRFAEMSGIWGADGALEVLDMMNFGEYRMVGQFALEKWIGQTESIQQIFEISYGWVSPQEQRDMEGMGEKPNNDGDSMQSLYTTLKQHHLEGNEEDKDNQYLAKARETRGRFETLNRRMRVHETSKRGEKGPQWLEGLEVWAKNPDGSFVKVDGKRVFNRAIQNRMDGGSSRHSTAINFWRDHAWWRLDKYREGQDTYPDYVYYYEPMDGYTVESRNRFLREFAKVYTNADPKIRGDIDNALGVPRSDQSQVKTLFEMFSKELTKADIGAQNVRGALLEVLEQHKPMPQLLREIIPARGRLTTRGQWLYGKVGR